MNRIHTRTVRALPLTLALVFAAAAQASSGEPAGITVSFGDLDLTSSAGAHTLYRRISGAARTVCGFEGTGLFEQSRWNSCYRGAIADAVARVNSPLLAAVHTGQPLGTSVAMLRK